MTSKLKAKWLSLWRSHRWLLVFFFAALFLDAISTVHFMQVTGPEAEIHPAVRLFSHLFGTVMGPILSAFCKAIAMIVVLFYIKAFVPAILLFASMLSLFAFFYNLYAVDLYARGLLNWLPF